MSAYVNPVANTFDALEPAVQRAVIASITEVRDACLTSFATYDEAAREVVDDEELRSLFRSLADERRDLAQELEDLATRVGHPMRPDDGSIGRDLRRRWIDVRATLEHHSPATLASECERSERATLTKYEHALMMPLSLDVEEVLLDQATDVRAARAGLDRLRHPW